MSYSSVLQAKSTGSLGEINNTPPFAPITLISGNIDQIACNPLYLSKGVWNITQEITFRTAVAGTTQITSLGATLLDEGVLVGDSRTIIQNTTTGSTQPYSSTSMIYRPSSIIVVTNEFPNKFLSSIQWVGAGEAPTASVILTATKLV